MKPTPPSLSEAELDALLAQARAARLDTSRAEYGFETRVLARWRRRSPAAMWGVLSWRLMPVFAAVALVLFFWQEHTMAEMHEVDQVASLENIDTADVGDNLN